MYMCYIYINNGREDVYEKKLTFEDVGLNKVFQFWQAKQDTNYISFCAVHFN